MQWLIIHYIFKEHQGKLESMSSLTHIRQGSICHKDLTSAPLKKKKITFYFYLHVCVHAWVRTGVYRYPQEPLTLARVTGGCEHLLTWVLELNGVLCTDSKCSQCWTISPISHHFLLTTKHNSPIKSVFVLQSLPWSCNRRIYDKVTFTERQWAETFVSL